MRDFIHIEDCVDGILATIDQIDDAGAVNLSTGIFTSFIEFARLAAELAGYAPQVTGVSDKPAGVHARGGDTTKQRQLGFHYKLGFREGLRAGAGLLPTRRSHIQGSIFRSRIRSMELNNLILDRTVLITLFGVVILSLFGAVTVLCLPLKERGASAVPESFSF